MIKNIVKLSLLSIFILLILHNTIFASYNPPISIDVNQYGGINAASTDSNTLNKLMYVSDIQTLTANITITGGRSIYVLPQGSIDLSTYTIIFASDSYFQCPDNHKAFINAYAENRPVLGPGTASNVIFQNKSIDTPRVEWFTDVNGTTDNTIGFKVAINSIAPYQQDSDTMHQGGYVGLLRNRYVVSSEILIPTKVDVIGVLDHPYASNESVYNYGSEIINNSVLGTTFQLWGVNSIRGIVFSRSTGDYGTGPTIDIWGDECDVTNDNFQNGNPAVRLTQWDQDTHPDENASHAIVENNYFRCSGSNGSVTIENVQIDRIRINGNFSHNKIGEDGTGTGFITCKDGGILNAGQITKNLVQGTTIAGVIGMDLVSKNSEIFGNFINIGDSTGIAIKLSNGYGNKLFTTNSYSVSGITIYKLVNEQNSEIDVGVPAASGLVSIDADNDSINNIFTLTYPSTVTNILNVNNLIVKTYP